MPLNGGGDPFDDILKKYGYSNGGGPATAAAPPSSAPQPSGGGDPFSDVLKKYGYSNGDGTPATPSSDSSGPSWMSTYFDRLPSVFRSGLETAEAQISSTASHLLAAGAGTPEFAAKQEQETEQYKQGAAQAQQEAGKPRNVGEAFSDFLVRGAPYLALYGTVGRALAPLMGVEAGAGFLTKVAAGTAAALPVTAALEGGDKDLSAAQNFGTVLGDNDKTRPLGQMLQRMAETPYGRILAGSVLDIAGNVVGEGLEHGYHALQDARVARANAATIEAADGTPIRAVPTPLEDAADRQPLALPPGRYDLPANSDVLAGQNERFAGAPSEGAGYREVGGPIPPEQRPGAEEAVPAMRSATDQAAASRVSEEQLQQAADVLEREFYRQHPEYAVGLSEEDQASVRAKIENELRSRFGNEAGARRAALPEPEPVMPDQLPIEPKAPKTPTEGNGELRGILHQMQRANGIGADDMPRVSAVDADRAREMAHIYESLPKDSPEAHAAYDALNAEIDKQYKTLQDAGYRFEYVDHEPYKSSREMMEDVRQNKRLKVLRTSEDQEHPYMTPEQNDRFRAVHDLLAHAAEGHQFGPIGEENAYRVHASTLSEPAQRALATETRGQNSYVNYGPNSHLPASERPFAPQKAALWPREYLKDYGRMPNGTGRYAAGAALYAGSGATQDPAKRRLLRIAALGMLGPEVARAARELKGPELDAMLEQLKADIKSGKKSPEMARLKLRWAEEDGTVEERAAAVRAGMPLGAKVSHDVIVDWLNRDSRSLADRYLEAAHGNGEKAIELATRDGIAFQRGAEPTLFLYAKPVLEETEGRIRAITDMEAPGHSRAPEPQVWWNMMRSGDRERALMAAGARPSQSIVAGASRFEDLGTADRAAALKAHDLYEAELNAKPIHVGYRDQLKSMGLGLPDGSGRAALGAVGAGAGFQSQRTKQQSHRLILEGLAAIGLASIPSVREAMLHAIGHGAKNLAQSAEGLADPSVQRVLKMIAMEPKTAVKGSVVDVGNRLYREWFDRFYSLGEYGRKVLGSNALSANARRYSGVVEAAHEAVKVDFTPVARAIKGIEPQVAALATAERALELKDIFPDADKGITPADARRTIEVLSENPKIRAGADALRSYYRQLLDRRLANGLITPDEYKNIVAKGQYYVPFVRDFIDDVRDNAARGSKALLQKGSAVRKMSDEDAISQIKNPIQQAMADTYLVEKAVARQRVTKLVVDGYDGPNRGIAQQFIREVGSSEVHGRPIESVKIGGKTRYFEFLDQGFHDAWVGMAPQSADLAMQFLRGVKNVQRVGVTMNPRFAAFNAMRDFAFTATQTSGKHMVAGALAGGAAGAALDPNHPVAGAIMGGALGAVGGHAVNVLRGFATVMGHEMGKDWLDGKVYSEFLREGGSGFGYFPRKQQELGKLLEELQSDGKIHPSDILTPQNWWHALEMVNHAVEQAPRFAMYRKLRAAGGAIPESIQAARDISVDFSNAGSGQTVKTMGGITPFFNAKLQGWDKNFRTFIGSRDAASGSMKWFGPTQQKAAAAAFGLITAPSVALWWQNKDDPDYWKQDYWVRNLFWLIPKGNGEFWKIPKPFEVGYAFASLPERFLDWAYQNKPEMFKDAKQGTRVPYSLSKSMSQMTNALGLDIYNDVPGIVKPLLETSLNKNLFTGRDIVPDRMTQLPSEEQYDDRTSTIARVAGRATGQSPMLIDHLINGFTGSLGQTVNSALTDELRDAGLDSRGPALDRDRNALFAGMSTNAETQPAPVTDVIEEANRLAGVRAGIKNIEAQGRYEDLSAYVQQHGQEIGQSGFANTVADRIRYIGNAIRQVETDRNTTPDEKRTRVRQLRDLQMQLAEAYATATSHHSSR